MTIRPIDPEDELLTPSELAAMFRIDAKTAVRWANTGKIGSYRTLGGHRRFKRTEAEQLLRDGWNPATEGNGGPA